MQSNDKSSRAARPALPPIDSRRMATWVLTGGIENFRIYVERGFDVIGFKERRRNQALEFEPGDAIVFYVTKYSRAETQSVSAEAGKAGAARRKGLSHQERPAGQAFGAIAKVTSEMFEYRTPIWPQGKKKYPEEYPWRVEAEPVLVLDEREFVPVESLIDELEHVRRWPAEHWHLAFQGQLRVVSEADAALVRERMQAAAGSPAITG